MKICEISSSSKWNEADGWLDRLMLTMDGYIYYTAQHRVETEQMKPTYYTYCGIVMETTYNQQHCINIYILSVFAN